MSPAGTTRQTPSRKLHSSPTPPVVEKNTLMTFFTRHTATPLTGPRLKAARRAGSSEKSIFTKDGIRKGMGKDRNIRMAAAALRMAVTASSRVLTVWDIKNTPSRIEYARRRSIPGVLPAKERGHLLPSRLSLSVPDSHRFNACAVADLGPLGPSPPVGTCTPP